MERSNGAGPEESWIVCQNSQGIDMRATPLRVSRHQIAFEVYGPATVLRVSEVLSDFKLFVADSVIYSGRAVVASLVPTSTLTVCEAALEDAWIEPELFVPSLQKAGIASAFEKFLQNWQKSYRISPQYKLVLTDMESFLTELRLWLEQVEVGVRSHPSTDRLQLEKEIANRLAELTTPALTSLFEKFEHAAGAIEPDLLPAHRAFSKRQLHPLLLCAPFLYRTYQKPLGYAGDYEMVNMITRDPFEGGSLFAKVINHWFLNQAPAQAHRNRIEYIADEINKAATRAIGSGRPLRVLSLGCGPALEVQVFLQNATLAKGAQFTLIDFNAETLAHTEGVLESIKQKHGASASVQLVKKSVNQLLKEASRSVERQPESQYDLVYCAGLFDYLSDQVCLRLSNILFDWLAPGGLYISTNVDSSNPRRITMEFVMEWHLIYRSGQRMMKLKPERASSDNCAIKSDKTGVNVYFEARRSNHA